MTAGRGCGQVQGAWAWLVNYMGGAYEMIRPCGCGLWAGPWVGRSLWKDQGMWAELRGRSKGKGVDYGWFKRCGRGLGCGCGL